jgi:CRP/FNR family cyclic AMP-dependent transcriptional regulator
VTDIWDGGGVAWLGELSEREREQLRAAASRRDHAPGDVIFAPHPAPDSLYLLEDGLVRIFRISEEGSETTFGYVAPGEVFGELAGFGDYPRESFAQAVHPSRVWKLPREAFQATLGERPALVAEITRQIGERLKRIEARVENLVFRDVRSRVAHMLLELADDFGEPDGEGILLQLTLTQAELASLVGSTRQTVNASLRELEAEGLIGRKGARLVVLRPDALRRAGLAAPQA